MVAASAASQGTANCRRCTTNDEGRLRHALLLCLTGWSRNAAIADPTLLQRSFIRRCNEAYLTIVLEICLSKERILDLYLNLAEWGDGVFGAEMAARTHFKKSAQSLTREEAARLAAILPASRRWSPRGSIASARIGTILARMRYPAPKEAPPEPRRTRKRG
ncbi:MAG: transglycosylase domain-containing protein [Gemmatimonadetes bacterium]|nr:transglycosylase domain-containing protein [Gemmatimonadota bacterium]